MIKRKRIRERGKMPLSHVFKEFKVGDRVALIRDLSRKGRFPKQFQGRTGTVVGKSGKAFIVKFLNGGVYKKLVVKPVHIKKLKSKSKD